jgi:hypothetical protein
MLYSSLDAASANSHDPPADANSYRPFKLVNSVVTNNIQKELDLIEGLTEERVLWTAFLLNPSLTNFQPPSLWWGH